MAGSTGTRMFTVDRFLGVNEGADGLTELKMGEASVMENFLVTDGGNLTVRPGIRRLDLGGIRGRTASILAMWSGHCMPPGQEEGEYLVLVDWMLTKDRIWVLKRREDQWEVCLQEEGKLGLMSSVDVKVKIFSFGQELYIMSTAKTVIFRDGALGEAEPYIPKVIMGAVPSGGGTSFEAINLLTGKRREDFSADGEAKAFVLPEEAVSIVSVTVDNKQYGPEKLGQWDRVGHTYVFNEAPVKGVGNVEFCYDTDPEAAERSRKLILNMPLIEAYNGSTDTRLFVAGDGSNICYYSGVTESGKPSPMYFPALNEVRVDVTGAAVTGLVRHYGKLLVFTQEGTYTISYEPVTQPDGSTVAGFYLRTMNREFGNECLGQAQTVDNYPRTVTRGGIYEWRITSSYYRDERYAKCISDRVRRSFRAADPKRVITCDDPYSKSYYVFLNDQEGTVLVNRYGAGEKGVWCIYKSALCRNIEFAVICGGMLVFGDWSEIYFFDEAMTKDANESAEGDPKAILAVWESGFMDFGADFRRKYSSQIYVSLLPQTNSGLTITAATDKRSEYMEKEIFSRYFSFEKLDFSKLTFDVNETPRIKRVRLKVKKFVYYKLIFRVDEPGAGATILGFDQTVRFASMAK